MLNRHIDICRRYAEKCFRRAIEPLPPFDFVPDWEDRPSYFKIYEDVERLALPLERPTGLISMEELLARVEASRESSLPHRGLAIDELALMLYFAHGILSRRLRIWPDQDVPGGARYPGHYGRGTASGGGLYPAEIYWACGPGGQARPGLYHYDNAHHAMERLLSGDVTQLIHSAVFDHPAALKTDQFLLITMNFWKNAFKYNSFCYHVVTQDLGALLCSLWFLATGFQVDWQPIFWYQDEVLNSLLGLKLEEESVFAVVPLPASDIRLLSEFVPAVKGCSYLSEQVELSANKRFLQRSREIHTFDLNVETHRSTLITDESRPDMYRASRASMDDISYTGGCVQLPPPMLESLHGDLLETFQKRHSSFGTFSAHSQLSQANLATMLYSASVICNYHSDVKSTYGHPRFTRLMTFINNVEGIEPGAYAYDMHTHSLRIIQKGDMTLFLQKQYTLSNYNMTATGAVIAIVGNVEGMLEVYGNRGYRILNAEAGLMAQGMYMIAEAMSLGCGAVLGFANFALNTALGLDGTEHRTLLFVLIGQKRRNSGDIDYRLV